jgi:hypothetical protein
LLAMLFYSSKLSASRAHFGQNGINALLVDGA